MSKAIATPSRTKEILEKYGLRAKKGYGQNFLTDVSIVTRCAEESHCGGAVIEIGPGIGSLTEQLAKRSRHVRAYEVDAALIPVLAGELAEYDNVEIILQDILQADLEASVRELKETYGTVSVCANLPYYITTPVLFRLFECPQVLEWITVMVQKEVGDRIAAVPGSPEYSALSVECSWLYDVKKLFNVPRQCFSPIPNVDSTVIRFERKEGVRIEEDFFPFVRGCFAQRRKTLYNNLREMDPDQEKVRSVLDEAGIEASVRPQQLPAEAFYRLYGIWRRCE